MIYVSAVFAFFIAVNGFILYKAFSLIADLVEDGRQERKALEDRLIALTDRDASVLVSAQEYSGPPAEVTYVDETREWELSPGGGGKNGRE